MSKPRKIAVECDWNSMNFQNIQTWSFGFLNKKQMSFKKKLELFKIAKGRNFAVECDWKSRISQNFQNLGFFSKIIWVLRKKTWIF